MSLVGLASAFRKTYLSAVTEGDVFQKIAAGVGAALAALGTWAWSHTHSRIDRLETRTITKEDFQMHAESDERIMGKIEEEQSTQREHIGKIFDQMRDMEAKSHEQHVELLNAIHGIRK